MSTGHKPLVLAHKWFNDLVTRHNVMIPRSKGHKMYVYIHFYDFGTCKT